MPPVLCFVTVDTEEDDWGAWHVQDGTVRNIDLLPGFQSLCEEFGAIPTYLVNWPVVATDRSRDILRDLDTGRSEIGTHCHPWNTPPVEETPGRHTSWMCNLPPELIARKLGNLHRLIGDRLAVSPTSFRAGRWGFGPGVAAALHGLGYTLDSSVSPWVDWSADEGPDYSRIGASPWRFEPAAPFRPAPDGPMLEVPATVGFFQRDQSSAARRHRAARQAPRAMRLPGVLDRLGVTNLRWLSPENSSADEMIRLARTMIAIGTPWLNVPLHSVTLLEGRTPFVRTVKDRERFLGTIREFLAFARGEGLRFAPLSAALGPP